MNNTPRSMFHRTKITIQESSPTRNVATAIALEQLARVLRHHSFTGQVTLLVGEDGSIFDGNGACLHQPRRASKQNQPAIRRK